MGRKLKTPVDPWESRLRKSPKKPDYLSYTKTVKPKKPKIPKSKKRVKIVKVGVTVKKGKEKKRKESLKKSASTVTKVKKHPNEKLSPRTNITQYLVNPTFESKEPIPFVSNYAFSKLAIRAVKQNNKELLQRLIKDTKNVCNLSVAQSVNCPFDAASFALLNGKFDLLESIIKDEANPKTKRFMPLPSLLHTMGTGNANIYMLGHATRAIQMSRGGKEGNNAFLKDASYTSSWHNAIKYALRNNVSIEVLQRLLAKKYLNPNTIQQYLFEAVRWGNRKLAGNLIKTMNPYGFNDLHQKCLLNEQQSLGDFKAISVKKKAFNNKDFTPLHAAAINPNPKHLESLINVEPDFNHTDADNWRATHYAAACEGSGPLELLLGKGSSPFDINKQGNTPLHIACQVGRQKNVEVLVKKLAENDPAMGVINQKNRKGFTALHLAAQGGHETTVSYLIKKGANVEVQTGAGTGKLTPLMMACQRGHMDTVKLLIENGKSVIDKKDKLKRTALTHACIDGQAHITSYLLMKGASADIPDTSGNTNVHYAAAYGWYFNLKLLMDAGAALNAKNDWQLTPLAVAYMKGHMGLADLLLQQPEIDINCKDDKGLTLLALTISNQVNSATMGQLDYLIKQKGADCTIKDSYGNSVLHHLASANVNSGHANSGQENKKWETEKTMMLEIAKFIMANSTMDLSECNDNGYSPMHLAILKQAEEKIQGREVYSSLALLFCKLGCKLKYDNCGNERNNTLHQLLKISYIDDCVGMLKIMIKDQKETVTQLLFQPDENGVTPFLGFLIHYYNFIAIGDETRKTKMFVNMKSAMVMLLQNFPSILEQKIGKSVKSPTGEDENEDESDEDEDDMEAEDEEDEEDEDNDDADSGIGTNTNGNGPAKFVENEGGNIFHIACSPRKSNEPNESSFLPLLQVLLSEAEKQRLGKLINEKAYVNGAVVTPLLLAIQNSDVQSSSLLIKAKADVNKVMNNLSAYEERYDKSLSGVSPLMLGVQRKLVLTIEALLKAGSDVNHKDVHGNTALHYAAHESSTDMVLIADTLLKAGSDVKCTNKRSRNAIHIASNSDTGTVDVSTEMIELLIRSGASLSETDIRGRNPLHYAFVKIGQHKNCSAVDPIAICSVILKHMDSNSIQKQLLIPDNFGTTPLHCAAKRGANICCMAMLRHCSPHQMNAIDNKGNSALGIAVFHQHKACVLTLLQANASLNIPINRDALGANGLEEWIELNQWKWAPIRDVQPESATIPVPNAVVKNEWQGVVYVILDLMSQHKDAAYNLVSAALFYGKFNLALTLLRIAQSSKNGLLQYDHSDEKNLFTILAMNSKMDAASKLPLIVAEALLTAGIPFSSDSDSRPIIEAAKQHNYELIEFFGSKHAHGTSFVAVAKFDNHSVLSAFFDKPFSEICWTIPFKEMFSKIIACGCDKNMISSFRTNVIISDRSGRPVPIKESESLEKTTILIRAIQMQKFSICQYLLKIAKVNPSKCDLFGQTPLMHAVRTNNKHIVKLLLNNDYTIPDSVEIDGDGEEDEITPNRLFITSGTGPAPLKSQFSNTSSNVEHSDTPSNGEQDDDDDDDEEVNPVPIKRRKLTSKKASIKRKSFSVRSGAKKKQANLKFAFTSKLDLNCVDDYGWSVIHHCVCPLSLGSWENCDIINLLVLHGAKVDLKDTDGKTAIDVALQCGLSDSVDVLTKLMGLKMIPHCEFQPHHAINNSSDLTNIPVNIENDSQSFINRHAEIKKKSKEQRSADFHEKQKLRPHKLSSYSDTGILMKCPATGNICSVLLNKVDLKRGLYGFYNFYRLQLIQRKGSNLHIVFTNWGRIGDPTGQYQRTAFSSFEDALKEYSSIFRQKTGNQWTDINHFQNHPHKYRIVNLDESLEAKNIDELEIDLITKVSTKLDKNVEKLMKNLTNIKAIKSNTKQMAKIGRFLQPFGKIQRSVILDAREKLTELAKFVFDLENMRKVHDDKNLEKCESIMQSLNDLSTEFYQIMPIGGFEDSQLAVIDSSQAVSTYLGIIDNLLQFETAGKIITAAAWRKDAINPLDYVYASLDCTIKPLDPESFESQHILHYIANGETSVKVQCIYKVYNATQQNAFNPKNLKNKFLLWHGTNSVNMISILKLGLLSAPPSAMLHGFLFGKGIYTADCMDKSLGYCSSHGNSAKYALLTEVALGKVNKSAQLYNISLTEPCPKGFNSNQGIGRRMPDPEDNLTMPQGYKIPLGKLMDQKLPKNEWLNLYYNEFIVYEPNQIIVRYIVAFSD